MTTFLDRLVAERLADAAEARRREPHLRRALADAPPVRPFLPALQARISAGHVAVIAEVKRSSPAAGVLVDAGFDPRTQALLYAGAGAAAISVLTEPRHWGGSFDDLRAVRAMVNVPVLCKDVIVDEHQVWQARAAGADAVLLIAEALGDAELAGLVDVVIGLGMEPFVEAHDAVAFERAARTKVEIIGANARDLREPTVIDRSRARLLQPFVRPHQLYVAESGITSPADLVELPARVDAILVGTALMRSADPAGLLRLLTAAQRGPVSVGRGRTVMGHLRKDESRP